MSRYQIRSTLGLGWSAWPANIERRNIPVASDGYTPTQERAAWFLSEAEAQNHCVPGREEIVKI